MGVDKFHLQRWRDADAVTVLQAIADHAKPDPSFHPLGDSRTTRWHAVIKGTDFELLLTGPKFYDTRACKGGGGGVDMAMQLAGLDFKRAVRLLRSTGL